MSEWILENIDITQNIQELSSNMYDNLTWKTLSRLSEVLDITTMETHSLTLDPLFSFSILNMYIYAQSFSHFTLNDVVEATIMTMGRAFRNIIINTLEIGDLRKFKENIFDGTAEELVEQEKLETALIPTGDKEKRKIFYKWFGIKMALLNKKEIEYEIKKENGKEKIIFGYENTYPHKLLKYIIEKVMGLQWDPEAKAFQYLNSKSFSNIKFIKFGEKYNEKSLFEYLLLLLSDFLNTSPESVPRYFNYRLLNHHLLRDVLYSLYFRAIFKRILDANHVLTYFEPGFELLEFDINNPQFKGLSGNSRIIDDFLYELNVGENRYDFIAKLLNIGIRPEEIFQSWKEAIEDLGFNKYHSILFIPVYPDQTFWGSYQKFLMDRHNKGDGYIVVLFLPTFYDILRFLSYHPEDMSEKYLYTRIGYYIQEVIG